MDPSYMTTAAWHDIGVTLRLLFILLGCVLIFALNMVTAHAIIPSLVTTGHIPQRASRLRPLFYMGALVGAVGFVITLIFLADSAQNAIQQIYTRWWI